MSGTPSTNVTTLQTIGNEVVNLIVCLSIETVFVTVYSILVMKTTSILLRLYNRNPEKKKSPFILLIFVYIMYLITLTCWIIGLVDTVAEVWITLVKNPNMDLDEKYALAHEFSSSRLKAINLLYAYLTCIGDGLIVWRVYAFWATSHIRHLIMILPVACVLAGITCSAMLTYCSTRLGTGEISLGAIIHPPFCRNIQTVSYVLPAVTTAVTTVLIIIKVWSLLRFSKETASSVRLSRRSRLESIVILLVETGIAYFLFFLAAVIQIVPSVREATNAHAGQRFASSIVIYQSSSIVGMYPTIIICLVHAKRSAMDTVLYTLTGQEAKIRGGGASISLGNFQAAVQHPSLSMGTDLESPREAMNLHMLSTGSSDKDDKLMHMH